VCGHSSGNSKAREFSVTHCQNARLLIEISQQVDGMNAMKNMGTVSLIMKASTVDWNEPPGKSLVCDQTWQRIAKLSGLSGRECQVCRLIFEGNTRQEAAEALKISTRTVRHYLESVHSKLDVSGRVGLVLRLVQLRDQLATQRLEQSFDSRKTCL